LQTDQHQFCSFARKQTCSRLPVGGAKKEEFTDGGFTERKATRMTTEQTKRIQRMRRIKDERKNEERNQRHTVMQESGTSSFEKLTK